jgi:hypothetical protein
LSYRARQLYQIEEMHPMVMPWQLRCSGQSSRQRALRVFVEKHMGINGIAISVNWFQLTQDTIINVAFCWCWRNYISKRIAILRLAE